MVAKVGFAPTFLMLAGKDILYFAIYRLARKALTWQVRLRKDATK